MPGTDRHSRACLRFGWISLAVFALLGLVLESLHLLKTPAYMEVQVRRELWTLAHAHGTLLALINIVFGLYAAKFMTGLGLSSASAALRVGALAIPAGFLLGGIGNAETDPSLAIMLVPLGAILVLYAAIVAAVAAWRARLGATPAQKQEVRARNKRKRGRKSG